MTYAEVAQLVERHSCKLDVAGSSPVFGPKFLNKDRIMNTETYKQCRMTQGCRLTTGWIPERGAHVGMSVELKGDLSGFWMVIAVGNALPADVLHERARDYRNTRCASDV
jgi:hypothetical protein